MIKTNNMGVCWKRPCGVQ